MVSLREKIGFFSFSLVWLLGMVWLFNLIFHIPVRSQLSEPERDAMVRQFGEKAVSIQEEIDNAELTYEQLLKKLDELSQFIPPRNWHLTEEQIHKYHQVVKHTRERFRRYRREYLSQTSGFGKALAIYAHAGPLFTLYITEGLVLAQMSQEEFNWVQDRLWEAALFAVNRKFASGKVKPEEKSTLSTIRDQLCWNLGFYKEDSSPIQFLPEKLDHSKIPRHNVDLFLRFKNEVEFRRINFESIEFDHQDIMHWAQVKGLPE